jgi:hypothetical protein
VKKIVTVLFILFIFFYVLTRPTDAAVAVRHAGTFIVHGADKLSTFLTKLAS